jgi:hypothetical protein
LLSKLGTCLVRRNYTPKLTKGVHIKWQRKELAVRQSQWRIDKIVKTGKPLHKLPNGMIRGVKDVGPVAVDMNAILQFGIAVSGNVLASIKHENTQT